MPSQQTQQIPQVPTRASPRIKKMRKCLRSHDKSSSKHVAPPRSRFLFNTSVAAIRSSRSSGSRHGAGPEHHSPGRSKKHLVLGPVSASYACASRTFSPLGKKLGKHTFVSDVPLRLQLWLIAGSAVFTFSIPFEEKDRCRRLPL